MKKLLHPVDRPLLKDCVTNMTSLKNVIFTMYIINININININNYKITRVIVIFYMIKITRVAFL